MAKMPLRGSVRRGSHTFKWPFTISHSSLIMADSKHKCNFLPLFIYLQNSRQFGFFGRGGERGFPRFQTRGRGLSLFSAKKKIVYRKAGLFALLKSSFFT